MVADGKSQFNTAEGIAVANFWQQIYAQKLAGNETYISVNECSLPSVNVSRMEVILLVTDRPDSAEFPAT